jgi:hypothetical protein
MRRIYLSLGAATAVLATGTMCLLAPRIALGDDLKLKDGTKISGTIVGFEDSSFKVKTAYGFALVQKDQVVSISLSEAPRTAAEKKPGSPEEKSPAPDKPKPEAASPVGGPAASTPVQPAATATKPVAPNATAAAGAPATAQNSAPPKPPEPEPIREKVSGNTYTNETYRFHMYKPPDWDVIASAPAVLPGAITAMGTSDDTTYLLIGQEPAGKSLSAEMDATEHRLRTVMENFRPLATQNLTVSGSAAMEHHFRGSVDQHDWSGVVVLVPRGEKLYTIFGMTRADNDLVQLQENVINRAIASLKFTE